MAANRTPPNVTNTPGGIDGNTYASRISEEIAAIWANIGGLLTSVAGTNAITANAPIALTSYTSGLTCSFAPVNTSSGAVTLNINSLGIKSLTDASGSPLAPGDLVAGKLVSAMYDGTVWRITSNQTVVSTSNSRLILSNEYADGTNGGTATSGSEQTYPFNKICENTIAGATFGSNIFTLPAGKYEGEFAAIIHNVNEGSFRLYNITDALYEDGVTCVFLNTSNPTSNTCMSVHGKISLNITAPKQYKIVYKVATTISTNGLGKASALYTAIEQYGYLAIRSSSSLQGVQGYSLRITSGVPSNALGVDGDSAIDYSACRLYEKVGGVYVLRGDLVSSSDYAAISELRSDIGGSGAAFKATRQPISLKSALILDKDGQKIIAKTDNLGRVGFTAGLDPITALKGRTRWNEGALSLFILKALAAKGGANVTAKLLIRGDSWAERTPIAQYILDRLLTLYSVQGATGWISLNGTANDGTINAATVQPLGSCRVTKSGWTLFDITSGTPTGDYSIDGHRWEATGTSALTSVTGIRAATLEIHYKDTTGTFRYRIDGGSWVTITGVNSGNPTKVQVTGLATGSTHTCEIDLTGNTGTMVPYGLYATGMPGIEISKIGNGSLHSQHVLFMTGATMGAPGVFQANSIAADGQICILGTNCVQNGNGISPLIHRDALSAFHSQTITANSNAGSVFITPPDNGGTEIYTMEDYALQVKQLAYGNPRIGLLNLHERWPNYAASSSAAWIDTLHLNLYASGALADECMPFLKMGV